ncbi:hypothetical protein [Paenibacillus beijingensis]|uniref:Uncharacterized protein n=1 Tax=Paenibacillus beijingensis TaxID=1126833 RepID=A0A0D5NG32_9BACL|nr:hypothetical protein [Paenibacillus beijingensis]AJY74100.1 hypothetical protein VN24_05135 [Paenibacillus beijingensis]
MTEPSKKSLKKEPLADRDNPEQFPTENESLHDRFKSEQTVDPIPVEDLTLQQEDEKNKTETKHTSSSERKYHTGC